MKPNYPSIEADIHGIDCTIFYDWPNNADAPEIVALYVGSENVTNWLDSGFFETETFDAVVEHHSELKKERRGHYE